MEALCERFLSHVEREVFPGGCFFASARPSSTRGRAGCVTGWSPSSAWTGLMEDAIETAAQRAAR